jgi:predicted O-methyltransferase YrrM
MTTIHGKNIFNRIAVLVSRTIQKRALQLKYKNLEKAFSIESHLTIQERFQLYSLSQNKKSVLEIGSYIGASACCFGAAKKETKSDSGQIFCVDTWNNDSMSEGNWDTYTEFTNNTKEVSEYVVPIRGFSTKVVSQVSSQITHLDLLFIDGDHSYEGAKADWESYKSFLIPGSVVIFHDFGWAEGVKQVIEEDVKPNVSSFNSLPNMWWGTIKG